MSAGTSSGLLDKVRAQSVFKHQILDSYITPFVRMTGSRPQAGIRVGEQNRVVLLDGFAGRGRYPDGKPASAEYMLLAAQKAKSALSVEVVLVEKYRPSYENLTQVTAEYRARGVLADAHHGQVEQHLDDVVNRATGVPLFLFLDPCGRNVPFEVLVQALRKRRSKWPPTEVLLNISADLTRRAAGVAVKEELSSHAVLGHVDTMCGGDWWRQRAMEARVASGEESWEAAAEAVVQGYATLLGTTAQMHSVVVPVRRQQHHQPIYHLVFLTRSDYGLWVFGDAVATARQKWLEVLGPSDSERAEMLFDVGVDYQIRTEQEAGLQAIKANLLKLADHHNRAQLVQHTTEVFGAYYGVAQEKLVRRAARELDKQGLITLDATANQLRNWVIGPRQQP
ncbi:three-Cys-motif partner protein TcmP [Nocardia pseudovaccinii]|uniref:three-Cys-motif partner protein TcmP n=1 Tax=Nocardia pseudovaccinii TaxID=189540 RepID=UPI000AAC66DB|nr:three-Cys-motif partner protein TcmP [Nocardia pseudovaccinii]